MKAKNITVKDNGVSVRIYVKERTKGGSTYTQYDVVDYVDGVRKFISFADEKRARAKAAEIAARIAPIEFGVLKLTGDERTAYETAITALRDVGVKLDAAAIEFAENKRKLGSITITEAVAFFLKKNPTTLPPMTVEEAKVEFLKAKTADKVSKIYIEDLTWRLNAFAEKFNVQISSITATDLNAFLRGLSCGSRSRNNYRLAIATLIKFCEQVGYLHAGSIDTAAVKKAKETDEEIEIFSAQEMSKLLLAAKTPLKMGVNHRYTEGNGMLPLLLLGGFAGLRTAEVERQRWEDINLERGFIRVTGAKLNTTQKRLVPIGENLRAWLMSFRQDKGLVCVINRRTPDAIAQLATRAGVPWKHNALRHSFISYRCAETQDIAKTSFEAGNSPKMIHRHYRELVTPEQTAEWFAITPANVFEQSVAAAVA